MSLLPPAGAASCVKVPDCVTDLDAVIALPFGPLGIRSAGAELSELIFLAPDSTLQAPENDTARAAAVALHAWFNDPAPALALPLHACGTSFQRRVWAAISGVPVNARNSARGKAERIFSASVSYRLRARPLASRCLTA